MDTVSITVSKLSIDIPLIIRRFHLHHAVLCLTNVNINDPLTHFYGFCKVIITVKAWPVISGFDLSRTCANDPNSTALSDVKCLFFAL